MTSQYELPNIQLDINDTDSLLYRLLANVIREGFVAYDDVGVIDIENPLVNPIIFIGPPDPFDDDQLNDMDLWKAGPIYLQWDEQSKVWTGGIGIHHHLDNSTQQGGIAFAYFFR